MAETDARYQTRPARICLDFVYFLRYISFMSTGLKPIRVAFWRSAAGREPVREFLQALPKADRQKLGDDIRKLQFGWPVGMPLVRSVGKGLWELRISLPNNREVRVFFVAGEDLLLLLHVFVKKSAKTPPAELLLAINRLKEMKS